MQALESVLQGKIQSKRIKLALHSQDSSAAAKSKDQTCMCV